MERKYRVLIQKTAKDKGVVLDNVSLEDLETIATVIERNGAIVRFMTPESRLELDESKPSFIYYVVIAIFLMPTVAMIMWILLFLLTGDVVK